MISAQEAKFLAETNKQEKIRQTEEALEKVIKAAAEGGNKIATFYPKSSSITDIAIKLLTGNGYTHDVARARNQQDSDIIKIFWGE